VADQRGRGPLPGVLAHCEAVVRPIPRRRADARSVVAAQVLAEQDQPVDDETVRQPGNAPAGIAYAEIHDDETATGVLHRAVQWLADRGVTVERVLSDNGSTYRSHLWRDTCEALAIKPKRTRPYRPQTNGKIERFHRTMADGWAPLLSARAAKTVLAISASPSSCAKKMRLAAFNPTRGLYRVLRVRWPPRGRSRWRSR
jgi:hypothetical protein